MKLMLQVTLTLTNEIINPITDDGDDLHTQSASKFLCYHFKNLIDGLNEDTYKIIRHTLISDNKYALEVLRIGLILSKRCYRSPRGTFHH